MADATIEISTSRAGFVGDAKLIRLPSGSAVWVLGNLDRGEEHPLAPHALEL